ncbi:hypothetical protein EDD21DRAFT_94727, partial [Dissophora ornata]
SRQANRSRSSDGVGPSHGRSHGLAGRSSSRKPNPFRTPRHDDDQDRVEETGVTSFEPYHDDDSDDDNNTSQVTQEPGHEGQNALNNPTAIHPKMAYTPYRVQTGSPSTNPSRKRVRAPRNPQGKMAWMDDEDEEDANEVIDVDALIAEQALGEPNYPQVPFCRQVQDAKVYILMRKLVGQDQVDVGKHNHSKSLESSVRRSFWGKTSSNWARRQIQEGT